jgi:hypothetical protein
VKRAMIARQLMRNTHISAPRLMAMLRAGEIDGVGISALDVARCIYIYGKGVSYVKGHETAHKSTHQGWEKAGDHIPADHMLEVDLMFMNDATLYIVGLARPTEYALIKELKSKEKYHMWVKLEAMIAELESTGVQVRIVRCDGEGAMHSDYIKMRLGSRGIKLDTAVGKTKVSGVERLIRTLRNGCRSAVSEQPYQFDDTLERWLLQNARLWYNAQPTSNTRDGRSPREKLYGVKMNAKVDARHAFGDYVQVCIHETVNDIHAEHTYGALALCPVGNLEGSC